MGIFSDPIATLKTDIDGLEEQASALVIQKSDKERLSQRLERIDSAYEVYSNAKPEFQRVLKEYYDPATNVFSADILPYLTEGMKTYIRNMFK